MAAASRHPACSVAPRHERVCTPSVRPEEQAKPKTERASGRTGAAFAAIAILASTPALQAQPRPTVEVSAPTSLAVTVYRDPERGEDDAMERDWPRGFAMISETRTVTLPPGVATLRFTGVAEGMVAVSAIVTGLPGGTVEKNRNAALLSPVALVDGTLGNRVTITRTDPATGNAASESAVIRTRADGGLVLQTQAGFEAVRCSGLPEKLTFERVPAGLSSQPVFTLDTQSAAGGTHTVTLTYLAWGFDWEANYVGRLRERAGRDGAVTLDLLSWLTVLNDNGQSFPDAELMAVAGKLNVESDFEELADPPEGEPLRLVCYPLGSTAQGSPENLPVPPPPPMAQMADYESGADIVVTGARVAVPAPPPPAMMANEENLGDLKLYRVPEPVTVSAKGQKQIAFLDRRGVTGRFVYVAACDPYNDRRDLEPTRIVFVTQNTARRGLGAALPTGGLTLYEPAGAAGEQLVAETRLRDFATGQDIELPLVPSDQVFAQCSVAAGARIDDDGKRWTQLTAEVSNANPRPVTIRYDLGRGGDWEVQGSKARVKDGRLVVEGTVPANTRQTLRWQVRRTPR